MREKEVKTRRDALATAVQRWRACSAEHREQAVKALQITSGGSLVAGLLGGSMKTAAKGASVGEAMAAAAALLREAER